MKTAILLASCLLFSGLGVSTATTANAAKPQRWLGIDDIPAQVTVGDEAYAVVDGYTDAPTDAILQIKHGTDPWTNEGEPVSIPAEGPEVPLEFALPTDEAGAYQVRAFFPANEYFPKDDYTYAYDVDVVLPPPAHTYDSKVTLGAPSGPTEFGKTVTVSGTVAGGNPRPVSLELHTGKAWSPLATGETDAKGDYTLTIPTDWYYRGQIRATSPEVRIGDTLYRAGVSEGTVRAKVKPTYKPKGRATDWKPSAKGVHWNGCDPITYRVNTKGAPARALAQVKHAFELVHQATGFVFEYKGRTKVVPYDRDHPWGGGSGADLDFAWGTERQVPGLRGWPIGLGGTGYSGHEITWGGVVLERGYRLKPGFGSGHTLGALMLHEIGHAMGLDHADTPAQIMYFQMQNRPTTRYAAGDLTGLNRLGRSAGCFDHSDEFARPAAPRFTVTP